MKTAKKICAAFLCFAMAAGAAACTPSNEVTDDSSEESEISNSLSDGITPAMWRVTSTSGAYMYCFGSIHATDGDITWPDYFEDAYDECDSLAFEYDVTSSLDLENATESIYYYMYTDGSSISDHISEEDYEVAVAVLEEYEMYSSYYDYFNIIFWYSLMESVCIEEAGLDAMQGVDILLITRAKEDEKNVLEVESEEEQLEIFNSMSEDLQTMLLESYLYDGAIEEQVQALLDTYEDWKIGADMSDDDEDISSLTDEELVLYEEYIDLLLTQRNIKMADTAEEYLDSGETVMMVVGAGHYYGSGSVLELLEERGYTVERVA